MSQHIGIDRSDGVLTLTLARPEKKNALTEDMYKALADALEGSSDDPYVRVILLRAEGDMFTAGNDIGEFAGANASGSGPRHVTRFVRAISTALKPVVAAVQGRAVGIGTTLLLHCDQVILAEGAQLSTPFVNLALVPEAGSSLLMPARVGHARAFSMFALGEPVGAHDAVAWGIATKVVPQDELGAASREIAARLARQPLGALVATKRLMRDATDISSRIDDESAEFSRRLASPEAREAFAAFAARRAPDFGQFH